MKIRYAHAGDIDAIIALGRRMMAESRFGHYAFSAEKTRRLIEAILLRQPESECLLLAEHTGGEAVGMLAGHRLDLFFSDGVIVQDRVYYVLPECRGGPAGLKLILAFRHWAESKRADELNINMSVAIDMPRFNRFMTHLGFSCCGSNFLLPLRYPVEETNNRREENETM